jgi:hypothetical protein
MDKSSLLTTVFLLSYIGAYIWILICDSITPKDSKFKEQFKGAWISLFVVGVVFFLLSNICLMLGWLK